ncbi:Acetolactate synthase large subunit [Candidatus Nitrosotalea sp. TS]|nr:Acetolactate synthase large subunit [Candidatus Nitrosotalea sp. TS]
MVKMLIQKAIKRAGDNPWLKRVNETREYFRQNLKLHSHPLGAAKVLRKLREVLPPQSIVTTEVGQHQMWASLFFDVIQPGTFL